MSEADPAAPGVEPHELPDGELVEQLATLVSDYIARVQASPPGPLPAARWADRLNATESVLFAVELLRAAEVTTFELAAMFNV
jgi:hypothetical protein